MSAMTKQKRVQVFSFPLIYIEYYKLTSEWEMKIWNVNLYIFFLKNISVFQVDDFKSLKQSSVSSYFVLTKYVQKDFCLDFEFRPPTSAISSFAISILKETSAIYKNI